MIMKMMNSDALPCTVACKLFSRLAAFEKMYKCMTIEREKFICAFMILQTNRILATRTWMLCDPRGQLYEDRFPACVQFALEHVQPQKKSHPGISSDVQKELRKVSSHFDNNSAKTKIGISQYPSSLPGLRFVSFHTTVIPRATSRDYNCCCINLQNISLHGILKVYWIEFEWKTGALLYIQIIAGKMF